MRCFYLGKLWHRYFWNESTKITLQAARGTSGGRDIRYRDRVTSKEWYFRDDCSEFYFAALLVSDFARAENFRMDKL